MRFQVAEGFLWRVCPLIQVEVFGRDCAGVNERLEVDDAVPVFAPVDDDRHLLRKLFHLRQCQNLKSFVQRAESAGKDHQRLREIREPVLAHEEVVKLEVQGGRDPAVGELFERQLDVKPDGFAAGF